MRYTTLSGEWQKSVFAGQPWRPGEGAQRVSSTTRGIEANRVGGFPGAQIVFAVFSM